MDIKVSKDVASAINIFSMESEIEDIFTPLLVNSELRSSFTKLSKESPIFQKSLRCLKDTFNRKNFSEFLKRYLEFYSNVNILSDELSLIVEKTFDKIEETQLKVLIDEKIEYVSSKSLIGSMLFLMMTSNEDIFSESLVRLEEGIVK